MVYPGRHFGVEREDFRIGVRDMLEAEKLTACSALDYECGGHGLLIRKDDEVPQ